MKKFLGAAVGLFFLSACNYRHPDPADIDPNHHSHIQNQCVISDKDINYTPFFKNTISRCPSYSFVVDPTYSCVDGLQELIIRYWLGWQQVIGDQITIYVEFPNIINDELEHCATKLINATPTPGSAGWTWVNNLDSSIKPDGAIIWIRSDIDPSIYDQVFGHEIGHSFGLAHNFDEPWSLMFPQPDPNKPKIITCQDKRNLCNVWGCNPGC